MRNHHPYSDWRRSITSDSRYRLGTVLGSFWTSGSFSRNLIANFHTGTAFPGED
jgi:hypothetical protein